MGWLPRSGNLAAVVDPPVRSEGARLTARGAATRERIVLAAAELMAAKGVAATTLDEVRVASGTSKSQLYHHFAAKEELVREVVTHQAGAPLRGGGCHPAAHDRTTALRRLHDSAGTITGQRGGIG